MTAPDRDPMTARDTPPVPGYHYEWAIDHDWEAPALKSTTTGKPRGCRYTVGPDKKTCGKSPVADLNRSRSRFPGDTPRWWGYCADHLYGRVLHDGYVWSARLVRDA